MRRPLLALLLAVSTLTARPVQGQDAPECATPREACAFLHTFLTALNERNWTAFRATLADDITVILDSPAIPERRDGRAAAEEAFLRIFPAPGEHPAQLPPPLKPLHLLAQDFGDVVVVSFELAAPNGVGRRTLVLHKTASGWRVAHIHGSSVVVPAH